MYSSRNRLKFFGIFILVLHLAFESQSAGAIALEFVPANQLANVGDQVTVGVFATNPGGTLIGEYDFFVDYDPNVLSLNEVVFGSVLGGPADSFQDDPESPAGRVNVSELSRVFDLTSLQTGNDILLFSMIFDTDMLGTSPLTFSGNIAVDDGFLGDELGQAITLDSVGTGSINVVPVPGAVWLMGSGLLALYGFKNRRSSAG